MLLFSPSCFPNWSDSFNIFIGRPGLVGGELGEQMVGEGMFGLAFVLSGGLSASRQMVPHGERVWD